MPENYYCARCNLRVLPKEPRRSYVECPYCLLIIPEICNKPQAMLTVESFRAAAALDRMDAVEEPRKPEPPTPPDPGIGYRLLADDEYLRSDSDEVLDWMRDRWYPDVFDYTETPATNRLRFPKLCPMYYRRKVNQ